MRERLDVFGGHMRSAAEEGANLGAEHEVLAGPEARAPTDPFVDEVRRAGLSRTRRGGDADGVTNEILGDGHLADGVMEAENILAVEQRGNRFRTAGCGLLDHGYFLILREVINDDVEHKAVELGLG